MKLTKEQVEEIIQLYEEGMSQVDLAERFGVSQPTINYWINEDGRKTKIKKVIENYNNKSEDEKRRLSRKKSEYMRKYISKRYKSDEEFRSKWLERSRQYQIKRREKERDDKKRNSN